MLPNSWRAAWVTDETGFQLATNFSGAGNLSVGTKVLAMKVSGKITTNEALFTTSTLGTMSPTQAMIQETAEAKTSSSRKPPMASPTELRIRQPTSRPVTDITAM